MSRLVLIIIILIREGCEYYSQVHLSRDSFGIRRLLFLTFLDQLRSVRWCFLLPALADPKHPPKLLLCRRETGFIHRARSFKLYVCFGSPPALVVIFPSWLVSWA